MIVIQRRNVHEALPAGLRLLAEVGQPMPSRAGDVIAVPYPVTTVYERPYERVLFHPTRDANPFFHVFEALWMLAGRNDLSFLTRFVKRFAEYSDDGKTLAAAYGHRWRRHWGFDQVQRVIDHLRMQPFSRRAVIAMWDPKVDLQEVSPIREVCRMILNLRGPNGSGKSTVARALLAAGEAPISLAPYVTPRGTERRVLGALIASLDLIVVGPYRTDCGGCDAIKTQDLVCESVRLAAREARHVFFEGVIVSTLFSRYLALSREHPDNPFVWAYLDTPLDLCLARIQARNGGKPIKTELVADKVRSIEATRRKALAAGERAMTIPYQVASEAVMELLR